MKSVSKYLESFAIQMIGVFVSQVPPRPLPHEGTFLRPLKIFQKKSPYLRVLTHFGPIFSKVKRKRTTIYSSIFFGLVFLLYIDLYTAKTYLVGFHLLKNLLTYLGCFLYSDIIPQIRFPVRICYQARAKRGLFTN